MRRKRLSSTSSQGKFISYENTLIYRRGKKWCVLEGTHWK